jgi:tungstate transport system substrate-binding protein
MKKNIAELAKAFIDFVAGEKGQEITGSYGVEQYGQAMYNDAEYASQYEH